MLTKGYEIATTMIKEITSEEKFEPVESDPIKIDLGQGGRAW